jgi:aspergillopepsin I
VKEIYARIQGSKEAKDNAGFFTFPCDARIPPISFTVGGNELFMEAETLKIRSGSNTCTGSIVYEETFGNAAWIFGDSLLSNFYTIFDYGNKQIGFATPTPVA